MTPANGNGQNGLSRGWKIAAIIGLLLALAMALASMSPTVSPSPAGEPPIPDLGIPALGCHKAKEDAAWVLRHRFGNKYRDARKKIECQRRISKSRWKLVFAFDAGGRYLYFGVVTVWRWPHDPSRFAYWIVPHKRLKSNLPT